VAAALAAMVVTLVPIQPVMAAQEQAVLFLVLQSPMLAVAVGQLIVVVELRVQAVPAAAEMVIVALTPAVMGLLIRGVALVLLMGHRVLVAQVL
jgi:hypothetical protein